jgi:hypothetical protein
MMKPQPLRMAFRFMATFVAFIVITCSACAQTPTDDVAAQVRSQGYDCNQPLAVTRDARLSKRDTAVWILRCRDSAYRVRLDPDMAAQITKLRNISH